MKTYRRIAILFFVMAIPLNAVFSQEILSYFDRAVSFQRPPGITLWEERPRFDNIADQSNYWRGKIRIKVDVYDVKALKDHPPTLFPEPVYDLVYGRAYLSRDDLLGLFKLKTDYVLSDYSPRSSVRMSYRLLTYHGISIGERTFYTAALNLESSLASYGYAVNTIGNPPALPGDSKTLSFAGVLKYL